MGFPPFDVMYRAIGRAYSARTLKEAEHLDEFTAALEFRNPERVRRAIDAKFGLAGEDVTRWLAHLNWHLYLIHVRRQVAFVLFALFIGMLAGFWLHG